MAQRPVRSIYKGTLITRRRMKTLTNHQYTANRGNGRYNVYGTVPQSVQSFPGEEPNYFTAYHHPISSMSAEGYPGMNEQWTQESPFMFYGGPKTPAAQMARTTTYNPSQSQISQSNQIGQANQQLSNFMNNAPNFNYNTGNSQFGFSNGQNSLSTSQNSYSNLQNSYTNPQSSYSNTQNSFSNPSGYSNFQSNILNDHPAYLPTLKFKNPFQTNKFQFNGGISKSIVMPFGNSNQFPNSPNTYKVMMSPSSLPCSNNNVNNDIGTILSKPITLNIPISALFVANDYHRQTYVRLIPRPKINQTQIAIKLKTKTTSTTKVQPDFLTESHELVDISDKPDVAELLRGPHAIEPPDHVHSLRLALPYATLKNANDNAAFTKFVFRIINWDQAESAFKDLRRALATTNFAPEEFRIVKDHGNN
ncbi:unnamed protein product [Bursaphelenchus okinawaensis]|uniref:Uncharacterized protein n=1 Tax=Bursaphelenchus okinawaensis TaxID=465554 RepID=A0A811L7H0_9BILA|nr:unnamed protein product [Bursaphelenchus okinawaensis]CAG9118372.1 unnamed protein product [Bursaphelenchus okinawaensis]